MEQGQGPHYILILGFSPPALACSITPLAVTEEDIFYKHPFGKRIGHSLSDGEKACIIGRKHTVLKCLDRNNIPCSMDEVPHIAVLGSGGGERAMVGLLGSLCQMAKEDLLDGVLYLSGVSGSTWCMAALYDEPNWSTDTEQVKKKVFARLANDSVSKAEKVDQLKKYFHQKDHFSLTDVWAALVLPDVVKRIDEQILSSYQHGHSNNPYPLFNVIDQDSKYEKLTTKDSFFELSPHEAGYSLAGAFVETSSFGCQFSKQTLIKKQPELDMAYIQGLCGSALADTEVILKKLLDCLQHTSDMREQGRVWVLHHVVNLHLHVSSDRDWIPMAHSLNDLLEGKKNIQGEEMVINESHWLNSGPKLRMQLALQHALNVCHSFFHWFEERENEHLKAFVKAIEKVMEAKMKEQWIWGTNYNFLHSITDVDVDQSITKDSTQHFEDAGLLLNSPYFSALRSERKIDIIISLDFSEGDPMKTVSEAEVKCKKQSIPFPAVQTSSDDINTPNDFYVFKNPAGNAPTVIHMPLLNFQNCGTKLDCWQKKYNTFQGPYSPEMISELMAKAAENISNNKKNLLEQIESVIREKRASVNIGHVS